MFDIENVRIFGGLSNKSCTGAAPVAAWSRANRHPAGEFLAFPSPL